MRGHRYFYRQEPIDSGQRFRRVSAPCTLCPSTPAAARLFNAATPRSGAYLISDLPRDTEEDGSNDQRAGIHRFGFLLRLPITVHQTKAAAAATIKRPPRICI
jgi:hypothetical protein